MQISYSIFQISSRFVYLSCRLDQGYISYNPAGKKVIVLIAYLLTHCKYCAVKLLKEVEVFVSKL